MSEVERLTAELDRLTPGTAEHDEACADLCRAHLQRAVDLQSPAELDLAVAAGERAAGHGDPYVRHALAWAYEFRWDAGADPADRDRAIGHWLAVLELVEDADGLAECARLLGERGESDGDPADASASIALFEQSVAAGGQPWWQLGTAYLLRHRLGGDLTDLEQAARNLDRGLADPPTPEWRIASYVDRLAVAQLLLEAQTAADPTRTPPAAADMLEVIRAARRAWDSGAGEHDDRARLAGTLGAAAVLAWQTNPDAIDTAWLGEMAAAARTLREPPRGWAQQLNTMDALVRYTDQARSGGRLPDDALDTLIAPLRDGSADADEAQELQSVATLFMAARAVQTGDRRSLRTAIDRFRASDDPEARLLGRTFELLDRVQRGDAIARDELAVLLARLRTEPLSYVARQTLTPLLTMLDSAIAAGDGAFQPVDRTPIPAGDVPAADRALRALIGPLQAARTRHDVPALRECAERFDELLAVLPPGHLLRLIGAGLAVMAGDALLFDEPGDQDAARRLLRWTTDGLRIAAGPDHPRWSAFALSRGEALRHLTDGDRAESRRWGLAALQGFGWQVLLQSGTDDAVVVAAEAGAAARRVAGWCQADGALDDLVAALDTGRGLVLYAATASRTIAERLTEAGHPELASQWRDSAGYGSDAVTGDPLSPTGAGGLEVPDDLRARVLRALDLSAPTPASVPDLRAGLTAAGADALVYLVPSSPEHPGAAVVVPAAGEPTLVVLPALITGPGSRLARTAAGVRAAGSGSPLSPTAAGSRPSPAAGLPTSPAAAGSPLFPAADSPLPPAAGSPPSPAGAGSPLTPADASPPLFPAADSPLPPAAGSPLPPAAGSPPSPAGAGSSPCPADASPPLFPAADSPLFPAAGSPLSPTAGSPLFPADGVRDAGPAGDAGRPDSGPDDLCRWAWTAAMEPLLRRSGLHRDDGPLRLVLVPTGPLSSVPWHAAFHTDGQRRHYAVEEAVISYAVSGRAFVESARESTRTVKSVLIVGDPTGDLPHAGVEARAIGAAFYPDAAFADSPAAVLDWIATAAPGPSLLHLACHGRTDPAHPADACLRLSGGELTARRLLDASRTAELEIEQVFLAACTTGLTGLDHDEAFSLTTAFLAAGARTAFGSLWQVPDAETSVLMFVVHHHLAQGCAPVDALHRAQLWMLDPDRRPPAGMPPELARHCTGPRPSEPRCWAAFTHQGR
ncbi:CHAT domain-containing protein [Actinoplanes sp. URMC 104]|uniref:CHAT domain-containing protein n=1 Tax=Actinoplanes sp. URMC 104 TaxID=3423409 RepID=UPI003F1BB0FB